MHLRKKSQVQISYLCYNYEIKSFFLIHTIKCFQGRNLKFKSLIFAIIIKLKAVKIVVGCSISLSVYIKMLKCSLFRLKGSKSISQLDPTVYIIMLHCHLYGLFGG